MYQQFAKAARLTSDIIVSQCEGCRKKKIACNGRSPCTSCTLRNRDCVYTTLTVTGRPSKGAVKLLQRQIEALESEVDRLKQTNPPQSSHPGQGTQTYVAPCYAQRKRQYGPTSLGPLTCRWSSGGEEDDYVFLSEGLQESVQLADGNKDGPSRCLLDLHTSFRLERHGQRDFLSGLGWSLIACRLEEYMANESCDHLNCSQDDLNPIKYRFCQPEPLKPYDNLATPQQVHLNWPSRERENQLINVYFRLVHPMVPVLCKETLQSQRTGALRSTLEKDPVWVSIMLGVFIAAARYMPGEKENMLAWWDARVQLGSHQLAHSSSIGGVQNLLLTIEVRSSLFLSTHPDWTAIGVVLRAMQDRGLHREAVLNAVGHDERYAGIIRCLWWTAQKDDVEMCVKFGRTPAAMSFDILPPRGSSLASPVPYFVASLKGLRPVVQTLDRDYGRHRTFRDQVRRDIDSWISELNEFFPFVAKEKDDEKICAGAKLWLFAYMIIAASSRYPIMHMFRKLALGQPLSGPKPDEEDGSVSEFKEARVKLKDAMHKTAAILQALVQRNTNDICFVDDDMTVSAAAPMTISCLLCYTDMLSGTHDPDLLSDLEDAQRALEQCNANGALFILARNGCSSLFNQLRKRIAGLAAHRLSASEEGKRQAHGGHNHGQAEHVPVNRCDPTVPNIQPAEQRFAGYTKAFETPDRQREKPGLGAEDCERLTCVFKDGSMTKGHLSATISPTFSTAGNCSSTDASSEALSPPAKFAIANDQTSRLLLSADPSVLMTNSQYAQASPDSKFWDDLLHNEMMLLDNFEAVIGTATGPEAMHQQDAHMADALPGEGFETAKEPNTVKHVPSFESTGLRRSSVPVSQLPSVWLGPILDRNLSPPSRYEQTPRQGSDCMAQAPASALSMSFNTLPGMGQTTAAASTPMHPFNTLVHDHASILPTMPTGASAPASASFQQPAFRTIWSPDA